MYEKRRAQDQTLEWNVDDDLNSSYNSVGEKNNEIYSYIVDQPRLDSLDAVEHKLLIQCEADEEKEDEEVVDEDEAEDVDDNEETDEVVAIPIIETVQAIEYDPDMKNNNLQVKKRRLYLLFLLLFMTTVIGIAGVVVGITLSSNNNEDSVIISYRETLGIRENIEQLLGTNYSNHLNDSSSPYYKAMEWITHKDPIQPTPNDPQFSQRYFLSYFYYATSIKQPWVGGCNPPKENEKDHCVLLYDHNNFYLDRDDYQKIESHRWLSAANACFWAGITCDEVQQVVEIDLGGMNQTGTFPDGILVGLPFLQRLKLVVGQLSGTIPDSIWRSKHLRDVRLRSQKFVGTIPQSVFTSRHLNFLDLTNNQLEGTISTLMGKLQFMKVLRLSRNSLRGTIPPEMGEMVDMRELHIDHNALTGIIPTTIGAFHTLHRFYGQHNALWGRVPSEVGLITKFEQLTLEFNTLTGAIPEELYNCTDLEFMILGNNDLTGTISTKIGQLRKFIKLDLGNNKMSGTLPTELGLISNFGSIVLSGNNFTGSFPAEICAAKMNTINDDLFFTKVKADCKIPTIGGDPEIMCPKDCCTSCCDSSGKNCVNV